jgi:monoamine oxidase
MSAGLSGLMLAILKKNSINQFLKQIAVSGGRINTITGASGVTIEMGNWFGKQHNFIILR